MMASEREIDASQSINDVIWQMHSTSIDMPPPSWLQLGSSRRFNFSVQEGRNVTNEIPNPPATSIASNTEYPEYPKNIEFSSQPIPANTTYAGAAFNGESLYPVENQPRSPSMDRRFNSFKTWSGKLERQLSLLSGRQVLPEPEVNDSEHADIEILPVNRYLDALEGPELESVKDSEQLVLPEDRKWPFLLRFPVNSFGICLGVSSQAILWRDLATTKSMSFLHISLTVNLIIWCISLALVVTVFFIYSLKLILYFEAVRREYYHPIRINFFFAPWIVALFLAISLPPSIATYIHPFIWYILMIPIFCLDLKIYGQWMSGSQRRLSMVANPSNHLAIVGNFLGTLLGAYMGLTEGPIFFFAVGLAHYIVLFVTLYQKLPTNETLPKELHPVFFIFLATPSVASISWALLQGVFDYGARIPYFIALFLYFILVIRINLFRGIRFSLTWWAYTFPMTSVAIATVAYSDEVTTLFTQILTVALSFVSSIVVISMVITTIFHAFVLGDLFPNDKVIAISYKSPNTDKKDNKRFHLRPGNSDADHIEAYSLKSESSSDDESEASEKSANFAYVDSGNSLESGSSVCKDMGAPHRIKVQV